MTLLSTAYFPPISWMAIAYQQKKIGIDLMESYEKQSYRNRCRICSSNGALSLVVPVNKPDGNRTITKDIRLDEQVNWRRQHWRSIKNAYQSSPFFIYYEEEIHKLLTDKVDYLWQLNHNILVFLIKQINFDVFLEYTKSFSKNTEHPDFRFKIHPKKTELIHQPPYYQVFDESLGFIGGLSSLDLLFNLGPESLLYLDKLPLIFEN